MECQFRECVVTSLDTKYTVVKNASLTDCSLVGVHWGTMQSEYTQTIEKLSGCRMKYNSFVGMNLKKSSFCRMELVDSVFEECRLEEGDFSESRLDRTQFLNCDLRKADFRGAQGYQVDITSCRMKDAKFSFPEVVSLLGVLGIRVE